MPELETDSRSFLCVDVRHEGAAKVRIMLNLGMHARACCVQIRANLQIERKPVNIQHRKSKHDNFQYVHLLFRIKMRYFYIEKYGNIIN